MQASIRQFSLIVLVQYQADKAPVFDSPGSVEAIAIGRPGADPLGALPSHPVGNKNHSIRKGIRVADLVAKSKDCCMSAGQVDLLELLQGRLPVALELTPVPGRYTQDDAVVLEQRLQVILGDIQKLDILLSLRDQRVELLLQTCSNLLRVPVCTAIRNTERAWGGVTQQIVPSFQCRASTGLPGCRQPC